MHYPAGGGRKKEGPHRESNPGPLAPKARILPLAHEATLVAEMFRRYADDGASIAELTRWLTDSGVPTRTGKTRWDRSVLWAMLRNPAYAAFLATQTARADPRLRRRDLKTLLSRPVTRLPRLKLLLERVHSRTDPEHPDAETLPLLLTVLGDLVKSAEPGIAVAEGKVGFWDVCESLVYSRGEIIVRRVALCSTPPG